MSWSDDMRCLYCDGKLPLYRKITHGQFCSSAHQKAYWKEQERLAVERLHQTHTSLSAYRPPVPIESILGPAADVPDLTADIAEPAAVELAPFFAPHLDPCSYRSTGIVALDPLAYDVDFKTAWAYIQSGRGGLQPSVAGSITLAGLLASRPAAGAGGRSWVYGADSCETDLNPAWPYTRFAQGEFRLGVAGLTPFSWIPAARAAGAGGRTWVYVADSYETDLNPAWPYTRFAQGEFRLGVAGLTPVSWIPAARAEGAGGRLVQTEYLVPYEAGLPAVCLAGPTAWESAAPGSTGLLMPAAGRVDFGWNNVSSVESLAVRLPETANLAEQALQAVMYGFLPSPVRLPESTLQLGSILPGEVLQTLLDAGQIAENEIPRPGRLLSLSRFEARLLATARAVGWETESPASFLAQVLFPHLLPPELTVVLAEAGQRRLTMIPAVPPQAADLVVTGGIGHSVAGDVVEIGISTPPLQPCLRIAAGSRYAPASGSGLQSPKETTFPGRPESTGWLPDAALLEVIPPQRPEHVAAEPAGPAPCEHLFLLDIFPRLQGSAERAPICPATCTFPQPLLTAVVYPHSKLEPIDAKAPASFVPRAFAPPASSADAGRFEIPAGAAGADAKPAVHLKPVAHVWSQAAGFWSHAPRDLKLLSLAIPALIALAFHPHLPKVRVSAPTATTGQLGHNFETVVDRQWTSMKQAVFNRAAVALDEDFREGLDQWMSRGDATTGWSFDATGFVRPGPLALYRPSMGLTDYEMQFLGMIDKKALSWVVRASDFNNYYVIKLEVLKPGPLTTVGITRYAVIGGKAQNRADTIVPFTARPDTLYRVYLDVHGDTFSLMIQGNMVDTWTERRLPHGGIGFFNARGEEGRVRWVQVMHQYDMLGRLCAYLAPYDISNTSGSW